MNGTNANGATALSGVGTPRRSDQDRADGRWPTGSNLRRVFDALSEGGSDKANLEKASEATSSAALSASTAPVG